MGGVVELTVFLVVVGAVFADGHGDCLLDAPDIHPSLPRHRSEVALPRLENIADTELSPEPTVYNVRSIS